MSISAQSSKRAPAVPKRGKLGLIGSSATSVTLDPMKWKRRGKARSACGNVLGSGGRGISEEEEEEEEAEEEKEEEEEEEEVLGRCDACSWWLCCCFDELSGKEYHGARLCASDTATSLDTTCAPPA